MGRYTPENITIMVLNMVLIAILSLTVYFNYQAHEANQRVDRLMKETQVINDAVQRRWECIELKRVGYIPDDCQPDSPLWNIR